MLQRLSMIVLAVRADFRACNRGWLWVRSIFV